MNDKTWCLFWVTAYKGGELCKRLNVNTYEMFLALTSNWDFLYEMKEEVLSKLTDEELLEIFTDWWESEDNQNLYAYDSCSATKIYTIKDGKLERDFPSNEEILYYMKEAIQEISTQKYE